MLFGSQAIGFGSLLLAFNAVSSANAVIRHLVLECEYLLLKIGVERTSQVSMRSALV